MRHLDGLAPLTDRYDGYVVDLWGVVHDGVHPYPGAEACLSRLRAAGKRIVLLSNAPRRAAVAQQGLRAMGLADTLYDGIVTSGEVTRDLLAHRDHPVLRGRGRRLIHLGPARDRNLFEGLELDETADPQTADLLLNTGPDDEGDDTSIAPWLPMLRACLARKLPMVCANPDLEVIRAGRRIVCAGAFAAHYEAEGGEVLWVGKPDAAVYAPVLKRLDVPPTRVLAIGDSLRTDIAGAAAAGIDSCWILGGIHAEELGGDAARVDRAAAEAGLAPVAVLPALRWQ